MADSSMRSPGRPTSSSSRNGVSRPTSSRLRSINEDATVPPPPIPSKSALRQSASEQSLTHFISPAAPSSFHARKNNYDIPGPAPPAYEWRSGPPIPDEVDAGPVEGEKLAAYRSAGGYKRKPGAISWRRSTWIIIAIVVLLLIGLIVGLAVGLTVGRNGGSSSQEEPASTSSNSQRPFPIGQYSMVTALRTIDTECTSIAETWSCFPYQVYDPAVANSGNSVFQWVIANSSSSYATIGSGATSDEGIAANLTISATSNPFSITFNDTALTYISPASNTSSARYTFSFSMDKAYNPPISLASNNVATQCFYNQTTFSGTLYLSAPRTYPESNNSNGALQWPYAIDITQESPGGTDTPACYEFVQGQVGARITTGLIPQPTSSQCLCEYRNY